MARSISSTRNPVHRGPGRPRTNPVAQHFTMPRGLSEALDGYIASHRLKDPLPRPEAIRRILTSFLSVQGHFKAASVPSQAAKAEPKPPSSANLRAVERSQTLAAATKSVKRRRA
jgi:hypothetical protein